MRLPGWPLLAALCAAATAVVVVLGTRLTFFNDDWYFLLQRPGLAAKPGLDEYLAPHNGHLVLIPVAVYKLLVALFGLDAQLPFRLVLGLEIAALGAVVYALVVARSGVVIALCSAAIVVLLGPAWEDLLFFNPMDLIGSLALGLAAIGVLQRDTPRRNALACGLLVLAVCMSNAGIPFVLAAAVAVVLRRRFAQAWIVVVPALVFGTWFAGWGHTGPSGLSAGNLPGLPRYVARSAAMGAVSITGLNRDLGPDHYLEGYILLALLAAAMVVRWVRRGPPPVYVLVPGAAALGFWALTAAGYTPGREPPASRYQLLDAALILVCCAVWFAPLRPRRGVTIAIAVVAAAAVTSNVLTLRDGYRFMRTQSAFARTDIGALEIAGARAAPGTWLLEPVARNPFLSGITAGRYFAVSRAHGAPPFDTPAQIAAAPPDRRLAADSVLAAAYGIAGRKVPGPAAGCRAAAAGADLALPPGDLEVRNRGSSLLVLGVRRFAPPGRFAPVAFVPARTTIRVRIPAPDRVALGWHATLSAPRGGGVDAAICPG